MARDSHRAVNQDPASPIAAKHKFLKAVLSNLKSLRKEF